MQSTETPETLTPETAPWAYRTLPTPEGGAPQTPPPSRVSNAASPEAPPAPMADRSAAASATRIPLGWRHVHETVLRRIGEHRVPRRWVAHDVESVVRAHEEVMPRQGMEEEEPSSEELEEWRSVMELPGDASPVRASPQVRQALTESLHESTDYRNAMPPILRQLSPPRTVQPDEGPPPERPDERARDLELVARQAGVTRHEAEEAYDRHDGDIVSAIVELVDGPVEPRRRAPSEAPASTGYVHPGGFANIGPTFSYSENPEDARAGLLERSRASDAIMAEMQRQYVANNPDEETRFREHLRLGTRNSIVQAMQAHLAQPRTGEETARLAQWLQRFHEEEPPGPDEQPHLDALRRELMEPVSTITGPIQTPGGRDQWRQILTTRNFTYERTPHIETHVVLTNRGPTFSQEPPGSEEQLDEAADDEPALPRAPDGAVMFLDADHMLRDRRAREAAEVDENQVPTPPRRQSIDDRDAAPEGQLRLDDFFGESRPRTNRPLPYPVDGTAGERPAETVAREVANEAAAATADEAPPGWEQVRRRRVASAYILPRETQPLIPEPKEEHLMVCRLLDKAGEVDDYAHEFTCPISLMAIRQPVCAADGQLYEYESIQKWLSHNSLSPVTKDRISTFALRPMPLIKTLMLHKALDYVDSLIMIYDKDQFSAVCVQKWTSMRRMERGLELLSWVDT